MTLSVDSFVARAMEVHGNKYRYDKVVFAGSRVKVTITCKDHGDFTKSPSAHLFGYGCPNCGRKRAAEKQTLSKEAFIEKAKEIHGENYCYDAVVYAGSKEKVSISCVLHGEFKQRPNDHLNGYGCNECGRGNTVKSRKLDSEKFIAKARATHGEKYGYERVIYKDSVEKVSIICRVHGIFNQSPSSHLYGIGCPRCAGSKGQERVRDWLTSNGILFIEEYTGHGLISTAGRRLRMDFFLPKEKVVIELDGSHHREATAYNGMSEQEARFVHGRTVEHDRMKDAWCSGNGVKMVRIPWDGNMRRVNNNVDAVLELLFR